MNGWDALNTVASVGLTGGLAYALARVNHSREDAREFRRRRQDILEKTIVEFDEIHEAVLMLVTLQSLFTDSVERNEEEAEGQKYRTEGNTRLVRFIADRAKLNILIGRLELLRLTDASQALKTYVNLALDVSANCKFNAESARTFNLQKANDEIEQSCSHIHSVLADAFHSNSK